MAFDNFFELFLLTCGDFLDDFLLEDNKKVFFEKKQMLV